MESDCDIKMNEWKNILFNDTLYIFSCKWTRCKGIPYNHKGQYSIVTLALQAAEHWLKQTPNEN